MSLGQQGLDGSFLAGAEPLEPEDIPEHPARGAHWFH